MNALALLWALCIALVLGDRLRLINWRTAKPLFVLMYVAYLLWALGMLYDAATSGIEAYQFLGMLGLSAWLSATRGNWSNGVPEDVRTQSP